MSQLRKIIYEFRLEVSTIILILGVFMAMVGFFGLSPDLAPGPIKSMLDAVGDWYLWFIIIGPFLAIFGVWYASDYIRKAKEFESLIETTSKAKFVKNLDRIEELAWFLTYKHQVKVAEKKKAFKIKK